MGKGYLQIQLLSADGSLPVGNSLILIRDSFGQIIHQLITDSNGLTETMELYAPDKDITVYPNQPAPYFGSYNVDAIPASHYRKVVVQGVQVYDTVTSILPIMMQPSVMGDTPLENINVYRIPVDNGLNRRGVDDYKDH